MNLFVLDEDIDLCAEYHIDKHVGKMQLEAAQLMTTALWVDRILGYIPRALTPEELRELKAVTSAEPSIEERRFTRYLPTHHNHPCAIWVRSSLENFHWTFNYVDALNRESMWRGNKLHASCVEVHRMPEPKVLRSGPFTPFAQAMPDQYKTADPVQAYRAYYRGDKAGIATWKKRGQPYWWSE